MDVRSVFQVSISGDAAALEVIHWAGEQFGDMTCGVIHQLHLEQETFDVVLIGSLFDGHSLMTNSLKEMVQRIAPGARPARLRVPPVVGGVILGMQQAGLDTRSRRDRLIETIKLFLGEMQGNTPAGSGSSSGEKLNNNNTIL